MILGCDETTTLTLSDADIYSLIDDTILKKTKKAAALGISVLKGKIANFKFFIQAS